MPSRAVLITGCSSGIGHATAARLAADGWKVYATARRSETLAEFQDAGATTLALDVTDEESMAAAVGPAPPAWARLSPAGSTSPPAHVKMPCHRPERRSSPLYR